MSVVLEKAKPKCLVLGGGGFMGSHLCNALVARGYRVRAFERPSPPLLVADRARGAVEWMYGDFVNRQDVAAAVEGCDVIFHLISTTLPKNSNDNPIYDVETNLIGTLGLLESARASGVRRIVFASSGGTVYGRPKQIPITESHPTNPICSYGITKLAVEKYLHMYHQLYGLDYVVLRLANPFGEGQRPDAAQGAIAVFLDKALNGQPIEIWGDGSVVRDYIYVGDIIDAFLRALDYRGDQRILNVGGGNGLSLNDILATMEDVFQRPIARSYLPARAFDVPTNVLDSTQARALLGWEPRVTLSEGFARTLAWLKRSDDRALKDVKSLGGK